MQESAKFNDLWKKLYIFARPKHYSFVMSESEIALYIKLLRIIKFTLN